MHSCKKIPVELGVRRYPVYVGENIFSLLPGFMRTSRTSNQVAIISVPPVSSLYLEKVKKVLDHSWQVHHLDIPDGESSKSVSVLNKIYTWLIHHRLERNCTILPLGGGVVGDVAGFAAATYMRGVNLIHLPTSLLAQVDSSVGGKVGINHRSGKNLIGAFYQPQAVLTDITVLKSLPGEEFICGLGEVIKYAILNKKLFSYLEKNLSLLLKRDRVTLMNTVKKCIEIKSKIVSADEQEQGVRAILNLGHTFGHALEKFYGYKYLKHGQAILLGLRCALHASQITGQLKPILHKRIIRILDQIPVSLPASGNEFDSLKLSRLLRTDKKVRQGKINLILIQEIGKIIRQPVMDRDLIIQSLEILRKLI